MGSFAEACTAKRGRRVIQDAGGRMCVHVPRQPQHCAGVPAYLRPSQSIDSSTPIRLSSSLRLARNPRHSAALRDATWHYCSLLKVHRHCPMMVPHRPYDFDVGHLDRRIARDGALLTHLQFRSSRPWRRWRDGRTVGGGAARMRLGRAIGVCG